MYISAEVRVKRGLGASKWVGGESGDGVGMGWGWGGRKAGRCREGGR